MIVLLHGSPAFGAVERYVLALVSGLRDGDQPFRLVYPDVPELAAFAAEAREHAEPFPAELAGSAPRLALFLARRLRGLRPAVAHLTDIWAPALVAARAAGVRRVLVTHHTPELPRGDNVAGRLWNALGWATRPTVLYTSEADRRHDARNTLETHVVPLGIDLERFATAAPALPADGEVIGTVGRLSEQKGHRYLIDAAALVLARRPRARFMIVGEGELREELEAYARARAVAESVLFLGQRDDVPELLASFDVFALPSLFEGLCLAVVEAQAAGVAVVATPVGGVRETVVAGESGVVCRPRSPGSLAEGILWVLDHPEESRRLAETARRRAFARFSRERMVAGTLALYRSAAS